MVAEIRTERIRKVIGQLNAISVGDIAAIEQRLRLASEDLAGLGIDELKAVVDEARERLTHGDLGDFRRLVAQAVSKLGHLR